MSSRLKLAHEHRAPVAQATRAGSIAIGVDTGGTFTDFVCIDDQGVKVLKRPSTPTQPERAILDGVAEIVIDCDKLHMVHGSTVATNALLESRGVRTGYVTNSGFADVLTIGRQARRELYNLQPTPQPPPVPESLCIEVDQRTTADGNELVALSDASIEQLIGRVSALELEAVAINLLFSWKNDDAERQIEAALAPFCSVSRSSAVLPEQGEYERGIATWLNASLGPLMKTYLSRLAAALNESYRGSSLVVMQSSGSTIAAEQAADRAVNLLLSGPAGGLRAANYLGERIGEQRLLTFDMGGTSTDVAMIDGEIPLTASGFVGGYSIAVPMIDMHTIGAGGGSIAMIDDGGMLRVGPQSAGAEPGPASYGKGGALPTVTDANVVLGRLPSSLQLGGLTLDREAACRSMQVLADSMAASVERAAQGILQIANDHMAAALRVISVERGIDPHDFALMSFGGAGGLHVCALADSLGMQRAIVPVHSGVFSALGMLIARRGRRMRRAFLCPADDVVATDIDVAVDELVETAVQELLAEGVEAGTMSSSTSLMLRYLGQSFSLDIPYQGDLQQSLAAFHDLHEQRYGHRLDQSVEIASLAVAVDGPQPDFSLDELAIGPKVAAVSSRVEVYGFDELVPLYQRSALGAGAELVGPAIVVGVDSTMWLDAGWRAEVDRFGNIVMSRD